MAKSLSELLAEDIPGQAPSAPGAAPEREATEQALPEIVVTPDRAPSPTVEVRKRAGDLVDQHRIMVGVRAMESRGKDDAVGPPVAAEKGGRAYGAYGMQEGTARDMGAKDDTYKKNEPTARILADRYYTQLYHRFGNHDDALAAYNWGPANVARWAAGGRAPGAMPPSVRRYISGVLDVAGLDSPGRRMAEGRKRPSASDLLAEDIGGEPGGPRTPEDQASDESWLEETSRTIDEYGMAFTAGALRGAVELPAGVIRAGAGMISEKAGHQVNDLIEQMDAKLAPFVDKHPAVAFAGNITGTTAAILSGSGLIGAGLKTVAEYKTIGTVLAKIPKLVKEYAPGAITGAIVGGAPRATEKEEENYNRVLGVALGTVSGTLGTWVGKSVAESTRALADQGARDVVLGNIKEGMDELGKATGAVQTAISQQALRVQQAGQGLRGFGAQGLDQAMVDASQVGKATLEGPQGVATEAKRTSEIMGVDKEMARKRDWDKQQGDFQKQMKEWQDAFDKKHGRKPPSQQAQVRAAYSLTNPPPSPPPSFVPRPIGAQEYAEATAYLRREVARASGIKKQRMQALRRAVEDEAGAQAKSMRGTNAKGQFAPDATAKFMREVQQREAQMKDVEPILDHFAERFGTTQPTGAQFYDWMMGAVERGKPEEMNGLRQIIGTSPRLQKSAQQMLLSRMMQAGEPGHHPEQVLAWFNEHSPAMKHFLRPDLINELQGLAKIQARITDRARYDATHKLTHSRWGLRGSNWLWYMGLEHAFMGAIHGSTEGMLHGGALVASGYFAHSLVPIFQRATGIRNLSPLLQRMAKMKPEGPAFDRMMEQVVRRAQARYIGTAQGLQQGPLSEEGRSSWLAPLLQ